MNLGKKKALASRTLKIGKERIVFIKERLDEIKEAITKQDIRDLKKEGAIVIKDVTGRKKVEKRKRRRGLGKIKKKINVRKKNYIIMTRKLRAYVLAMLNRGEISKEDYKEIRKKIRNKAFRSKAHLKEYIGGLNK